MAEFRVVVNDETTTNQEEREQVERVIQHMQEPDADTITAVLGPETADSQSSSSIPVVPMTRQAHKKRGRNPEDPIWRQMSEKYVPDQGEADRKSIKTGHQTISGVSKGSG